MNVGKAIYSILNADSTVSGLTTRIYGNEAKQGIDFPCIIYSVISGVPINTKSGSSAYSARVQVDSFGLSYDEAIALDNAVVGVLKDKGLGTYGTIVVQSIKMDSTQDLTDTSGEDGVNRISTDFIVYYNG